MTELKHVKGSRSVFLWWLLGLIPILNLYWMWRVSKLVAYHEED